MKMHLTIFVFILTAFLLGCGKSSNEGVLSSRSIIGKWKYTENYVSPGSIWHWEQVNNGGVLNIYANYTYEVIYANPTDQLPFTMFSQTGKIDSIFSNRYGRMMTYILPDHTTDTSFIWPLKPKLDTLEFSLPCFEGCVYRFKRVN
ncbi:MAG: hypothetical protein E6Q95_00420 [Chitinophagaceae bacterium]|nr:MAG: hypothetical protein E6Q95_00420 [Chitinophagaceae bacterium]